MGRLLTRRGRSSLLPLYLLLGFCAVLLAAGQPTTGRRLFIFCSLAAALLGGFFLRLGPLVICPAAAVAAVAMVFAVDQIGRGRLEAVFVSGLVGLVVGFVLEVLLPDGSKDALPSADPEVGESTTPPVDDSEPILAEVVPPPPRVYSVPRRYDLSLMLVVFVGYAVLFGVMQAMSLDPAVFAVVALFFTSVGIGQAVLFGGENPRVASGVVGGVFFFLLAVVLGVIGNDPLGLLCASIQLAILGISLGYAAGVFVGSVFMFAETARVYIRRLRAPEHAAESTDRERETPGPDA